MEAEFQELRVLDMVYTTLDVLEQPYHGFQVHQDNNVVTEMRIVDI